MSRPNGVQLCGGDLTASATSLSIGVASFADVAIQLTNTFTATVQFEATVDNQTWVALALTPSGGGSAVTSATAPGAWDGDCGGYYAVRARCSAFTSGVISVSLRAAVSTVAAVAVVSGDGLDGIGTIGDPLAVQVDDVTIGINGSNQLEALGGAPGGATTSVQYNNSGAFGGFGSWAGGVLTVPAAAIGTAPFASVGTIRLPYDVAVNIRDSYDSVDFPVISIQNVAGSDRLTFGALDDAFDTVLAGAPSIPNGQALGWINAAGESKIDVLVLDSSDVLTVGNVLVVQPSDGVPAISQLISYLPTNDFPSPLIGIDVGADAGTSDALCIGNPGGTKVNFNLFGSAYAIIPSDVMDLGSASHKFGNLYLDGAIQATYKSSDGSDGITAGPFTTITAIKVKDGIVTTLTGS